MIRPGASVHRGVVPTSAIPIVLCIAFKTPFAGTGRPSERSWRKLRLIFVTWRAYRGVEEDSLGGMIAPNRSNQRARASNQRASLMASESAEKRACGDGGRGDVEGSGWR